MADTQWHEACAADDVQEGELWPATVDGQPICLYRVGGTVYATEDLCSHGSAKLSDGFVEGHEVECPYHGGRFDVRTGQATLLPCTRPVATFAAEERDAVIWIAVTQTAHQGTIDV